MSMVELRTSEILNLVICFRLLTDRTRVSSGRRTCGRIWTFSSCRKASRAISDRYANCHARSKTLILAKYWTKEWKNFATLCRCLSTSNTKLWEIGKFVRYFSWRYTLFFISCFDCVHGHRI